DGTYVRVYTAKTVSTGNTVSLKLSGWGSAAVSGAYAVTQGSVAQTESSVKTDKVTYTAGGDISVTVTLKDAQGNGVTGQQSVLTTEAVTVPNAGVKPGSSWVDNRDGTYVRVYTAKTVSTGNTVSLKLSGWGSAAVSGAYAVSPGNADAEKSKMSIDKSRIVANNNVTGTDIATVTLQVRDANSNAITGLENDLQFVVLKGNEVVTDGVFIKNISATATGGQYTADVSGIKAGNYVIKVKISGEYFGELNVGITLYSYDFYIINSAVDRVIIPNQTVKYTLLAKATDAVGGEITVSNITWSSSDNGTAKFTTGDTITGIKTGNVTVTASGVTLNGINNADLTTKLTVSPPKESAVYGNVSGTPNTDLIKAPDYSLYVQTGSIVDGVGSSQGGGGNIQTIEKLNSMKSITTSVCTRQKNRFGGLLGQIVFNSKENTVQTAGKNACGGASTQSTWNVPANATIVGVKTWLGKGDTSEQFPGVVAIQWLYYQE
ncbi:beta-prism lectin domain-containing protein, partial [Morganella psychrotolerans]|uniref:beta-prism lectin domain-containing protein n=1 Tax=Morganella psychrotolerans TaxID=368603 RepID=UPI000A94D459